MDGSHHPPISLHLRPAWRRVLSHFHDPLVYLLLAAVAIALVAWVIEGLVGWPVDAIVIATIVLLNGFRSVWRCSARAAAHRRARARR